MPSLTAPVLLVSAGHVAAFPVSEVLHEHNVYRCMHGVPLLSWNGQIAQQAQAWAQTTHGVMTHGGMDGYPGGRLGQNLAGLLPQYGWNEKKGVDMWYDEIKSTPGGRVTAFGMNTGHYTQVVWRGTRQVGCGEWVQGTCNNGGNPCLLVCDYFPAGNMMGAFAQNVNGPIKARAQCQAELLAMDTNATLMAELTSPAHPDVQDDELPSQEGTQEELPQPAPPSPYIDDVQHDKLVAHPLVDSVVNTAAFPVNQVLQEHNVYRCMHGVPLLRWNGQIAQQAQAWAQTTRGVMTHGGMDGYPGGRLGQNLAGLLPQYGWNEKKGVDMWYDEIKSTPGGRVTAFGMNTGHYTQVVWRGTRQVGCGEWVQGTCNNGGNPCLLVCDYFPAGNMMGAFAQNVNGPIKARAQCQAELLAMDTNATLMAELTSPAQPEVPMVETQDFQLVAHSPVASWLPIVGIASLGLVSVLTVKAMRRRSGTDAYVGLLENEPAVEENMQSGTLA